MRWNKTHVDVHRIAINVSEGEFREAVKADAPGGGAIRTEKIRKEDDGYWVDIHYITDMERVRVVDSFSGFVRNLSYDN